MNRRTAGHRVADAQFRTVARRETYPERLRPVTQNVNVLPAAPL